MPDSAQDKTEKPTHKRLDDARKEGNIAQSADVSAAAVLLAGILGLKIFGSNIANQIELALKQTFLDLPAAEITTDNIPTLFFTWATFFLKLILPFLLVIMVVGVLVGLSQSKMLFTTKPLEVNLKRLNPISNLKQKFSLRGIVELAKGSLKIFIICWIAYLTVKAEIPALMLLVDQDLPRFAAAICGASFRLATRIIIAFIIIAALDYFFQAWKHKKDLMMSKQDIKDEHKQTEGDPHVKGRIRRLQIQASLNRMIKAIPTADVVVTNPVHLAVALKYDPAKMQAPKVVGKGKRKMAERIKELAREHNIPIVEEPELARALYKACEIGSEIPYQLYEAVAEVLALVYKLRRAA
ncbi:MAG: flagellar biosynthesis protein FlhB [Calditrichaeota bacterium]|nr:flagellar biosynthesis protein FlhB [Calditrichota bacterium]